MLLHMRRAALCYLFGRAASMPDRRTSSPVETCHQTRQRQCDIPVAFRWGNAANMLRGQRQPASKAQTCGTLKTLSDMARRCVTSRRGVQSPCRTERLLLQFRSLGNTFVAPNGCSSRTKDRTRRRQSLRRALNVVFFWA
jgi:hypothetical protein